MNQSEFLLTLACNGKPIVSSNADGREESSAMLGALMILLQQGKGDCSRVLSELGIYDGSSSETTRDAR